MGSSHSKPTRQPTNYSQPYKSKKRSRAVAGLGTVSRNPSNIRPHCNTFLAAPTFGRAVYLDPRDMEIQKVSNCIVCRRLINKEVDDIVLHNVQSCQATYHAHCMRYWIRSNFIDRHGRESRPHCRICPGTMNIRLGKGPTKNNPMGFYPFPGPAFPGAGRPKEVSGWY